MKTYIVIVNVNLEYEVEAKNENNAKIAVANLELPKEYVEDSFKFVEAIEEDEEEERSCVKCGRTSGLLEDEDICYTCASERNRC